MTNPTTPAGAGKDETTKWLSAERKAELRASNIGIVDCGPPDSRSYATAGEVLALLAELAAVNKSLESGHVAHRCNGIVRPYPSVFCSRLEPHAEADNLTSAQLVDEMAAVTGERDRAVAALNTPPMDCTFGDTLRKMARWMHEVPCLFGHEAEEWKAWLERRADMVDAALGYEVAQRKALAAHARSLATDIHAECRALADGIGKAGEEKR